MKGIFLVHGLATIGMTAVIWFVQIVHYPLFAAVGTEAFARYEALHTRTISLIVIPLMLAELVTAGLIAFAPAEMTPFARGAERSIGMGFVLAVWAVTFLLSVPAHEALGGGFDPAVHRRLVATNWLRTFGWSLRTGLVTLWWWRLVDPTLTASLPGPGSS